MLVGSLRQRGGGLLRRLSSSTSTLISKHSALSVPPLPQWVPLRLLSAASPNEDSPATVSLLVQSLGVSPEAALSVYTKLRTKKPKTVGPVISLFKARGFSADQICRMIRISPRLLLCSPERNLLPKLDFFVSTGLSGHDLAEFLSSNPDILLRSLNGSIIPHFNFLRSILKSDEKVLQAARQLNRYRPCDIAAVAANTRYLLDNGVSVSNVTYLLQYGPPVLYFSQAKLTEVVRGVKDRGLDPGKPQFRRALMVGHAMSVSSWESKARVYQKWGWSEEELLSAFRKYPLCMAASDDKINRVMSFFVDRMGWKPSLIAEHPFLIGQSLEKKTIPRATALQFLLSVVGLSEKHLSSVGFLYMDEKRFVKRLSRFSAAAPRILEIYQEERNEPR